MFHAKLFCELGSCAIHIFRLLINYVLWTNSPVGMIFQQPDLAYSHINPFFLGGDFVIFLVSGPTSPPWHFCRSFYHSSLTCVWGSCACPCPTRWVPRLRWWKTTGIKSKVETSNIGPSFELQRETAAGTPSYQHRKTPLTQEQDCVGELARFWNIYFFFILGRRNLEFPQLQVSSCGIRRQLLFAAYNSGTFNSATGWPPLFQAMHVVLMSFRLSCCRGLMFLFQAM